ncbi:hypothetical protein [Actinoplanes sp. NPDC049316]|uniref:hypothetical protein n=1 Tax=Actinoplanes sp. NPDC049316 TaxID=3154727 RepID=UPI003447BAA1
MSTSILSTFPVLREQARHALLLLGAPAPANLVVDVHTALFDGDLSMSGLATVLRDEERQYDPDALRPYRICPALHHDLTVARGLVALSCWPGERRMMSPVAARANALAAVVRIAEFVVIRNTASPAVLDLLRRLAETVPGGPEAFLVHDPRALADAARAARAELSVEAVPETVLRRWEGLDERQRLFGITSLPHQRARA